MIADGVAGGGDHVHRNHDVGPAGGERVDERGCHDRGVSRCGVVVLLEVGAGAMTGNST